MKYLKSTFHGKTVLITGHTGFKGSWLALWLSMLGAKVVGISKKVPTTPSNFETLSSNFEIIDLRLDITNGKSVCDTMCEYQPDFVFHLAAQALVRPSYESPVETFMTNAIGTAMILDSLRVLSKPVIAVMITSDKVYDNVEWSWGYRETDRLGGKDPYSASKGMAELAIRSYVESFFNVPDSNVRVGVTRAGNVIGGGDWAVDRIVPYCMEAWASDLPVNIRSPNATRPWQHVLEPLSGYLQLAATLAESAVFHGESYNFGPPADQSYSVGELIDSMAVHWGNALWNDISSGNQHLHEAGLLKLNCDKALFDLNWKPTLNFQETVRMTVEWYKYYYQNCNNLDAFSMYDFAKSQIEDYGQQARRKDLSWAK